MSKSKNTERLVEKYLENMHVRHRAEMDRRIACDSTEAMEKVHRARAGSARAGVGRIIMMHRTRRVAAILAVAVVLAGAIGLGGGSVAFSQAGHAVSSTLARLKEMIVEIRTGQVREQPPLPAASDETQEPAPNPDRRAVMCVARFFNIPASEQAVWQSLKDQGAELIKASAAPETYYATLTREQAERFENALTIGPITSPRILVGEGNEGMIGTNVFALAWLPTVSTDGTQIESSFSFHDGENGFEIPNVSVEEGGVILVRVKGIVPTGEDMLILLAVGHPQAQ